MCVDRGQQQSTGGGCDANPGILSHPSPVSDCQPHSWRWLGQSNRGNLLLLYSVRFQHDEDPWWPYFELTLSSWRKWNGINCQTSCQLTSPQIGGCTSCGVYVPCIYTHARWELPQTAQVFVVVLVWHVLSANSFPCMLITSPQHSTLVATVWHILSAS